LCAGLPTPHKSFRIRKSKEDGGATDFADCVWKPLVLIEMNQRGTDLKRTYRQAFEHWTRVVRGRANRIETSRYANE